MYLQTNSNKKQQHYIELIIIVLPLAPGNLCQQDVPSIIDTCNLS